jgi:hypothetical protein
LSCPFGRKKRNKAKVGIIRGGMLRSEAEGGSLPTIDIYRFELLKNWKNVSQRKSLKRIDPLP